MFGWVSVLVCGVAAYLMFNISKGAGIFALVVLGVNFWSLGIIHNYGPGQVRDNYERFVVTLNMLSTIVGVILLVVALVAR